MNAVSCACVIPRQCEHRAVPVPVLPCCGCCLVPSRLVPDQCAGCMGAGQSSPWTHRSQFTSECHLLRGHTEGAGVCTAHSTRSRPVCAEPLHWQTARLCVRQTPDGKQLWVWQAGHLADTARTCCCIIFGGKGRAFSFPFCCSHNLSLEQAPQGACRGWAQSVLCVLSLCSLCALAGTEQSTSIFTWPAASSAVLWRTLGKCRPAVLARRPHWPGKTHGKEACGTGPWRGHPSSFQHPSPPVEEPTWESSLALPKPSCRETGGLGSEFWEQPWSNKGHSGHQSVKRSFASLCKSV